MNDGNITIMKKSLFLFVLALLPIMASATVIEGINYSFDSKTKTAKVAKGTGADKYSYSGDVVIPQYVKYKDVVYVVTAIGSGAISGFKDVTSVTIPNSVTSIDNSAFESCSGLASIVIPNSVTTIGYHAFKGCSALTTINIPNSVITISEGAFANCTSLTSVSFGKGLTTIGKSAFEGCSSLPSVTIPDNVKTIGVSAFNFCTSLISATTGNGISEINIRAFGNCSSLTSLTIGKDVTTIAGNALEYCSSIISFTIPSGVTDINSYAFKGCSGLTTVVLPNTLSSIGSYAFQYCNNLTNVIADIAEPISIKVYTFPKTAGNTIDLTLYVPKGSANAYANANIWKMFKEIKEFVKKDNVVYTIEGTNTITAKAPTDQAMENVVIPKSINIDGVDYTVTAIDKEAFIHKKTLTVASIPESINQIGNSAFAGCSGLKAIYSYAEDPIELGSSDSDENTASTVFADVDKQNCILYVPKNSINKYSIADGWKEFLNIVEIKSESPYDANNDGKFDINDIYAIVDYIMLGKTDGFIFKKADANGDNKVDAADIVEIVNKIK